MARMMGRTIHARIYCSFGCCTSIPLWRKRDRQLAHQTQRARDKRAARKEIYDV